MVKLEGNNGAAVFVRPSAVRSIHAHEVSGLVTGASWVRVDQMSHLINGAPDEVYAKLFPEAAPSSIADSSAALSVLNRIADNPQSFGTDFVLMARTALGREGA